MSHSSEDETDVSESELDEYADRCYEQLKADARKVIFSGELYRCPYCPGKKKLAYPIKDLLQHASDVGQKSQSNDTKRRGKHISLHRFMKNDILPLDDISSSLASGFSGLALEAPDLFVWPWMGILANVGTEGISKAKSDLVLKGLRPVRIRALPGRGGGGYAVVEFERSWSGFYRAVVFERSFEAENRGKKDYCDGDSSVLCGWIAREEDYVMEGVLGEYLRRNGDVKTVDDVEVEEKRRNGMLVADLTKTIEELRNCLDEVGR